MTKELHKESDIVRFAAAIAPDTVVEETRSVLMNFYTGASVERYDWSRGEKYFLRLSIEKGECQIGKLKNAPLLDSHMDYSVKNVLGVITAPMLDDRGCVATATFSDDEDSDCIFKKVKNGTLRNLSVGAVIQHLKLESKEGEVPSYVADKWYPREVSIVPLGADPDAHFLSDQLPIARLMDQASDQPREAPPTQKENQMSEAITSPAVTQTTPPADPKVELRTEPVIDHAALAKDAAELAVKNERERSTGIQDALKAAKITGKFADELLRSNVSIDAARSQIFTEMARLSDELPTDSNHSTAGASDSMAKMESAAAAAAISDPKKTKEQHFAAMLRANPKAYDESLATV